MLRLNWRRVLALAGTVEWVVSFIGSRGPQFVHPSVLRCWPAMGKLEPMIPRLLNSSGLTLSDASFSVLAFWMDCGVPSLSCGTKTTRSPCIPRMLA